ncbi:MAG: hypothetical protein H7098_08045 [Oligoflexus sp.]|nr:hypothetical protein [Pseudopedobacter sp.]
MVSTFTKTKFKISFAYYIIFFLFFISINPINAQENLSPDEMLIKVRKLAFDDKNYLAAIALTKKALLKSPDYTDVEIFLGRLYNIFFKIGIFFSMLKLLTKNITSLEYFVS